MRSKTRIAALLLSLAVGLIQSQDFREEQAGFEFQYYYLQDLILTIHDNRSCYFSSAPSGVTLDAGQFEKMKGQIINAIVWRDVTRLSISTLSAMTNRYTDSLIGVHCARKDVYTLQLFQDTSGNTRLWCASCQSLRDPSDCLTVALCSLDELCAVSDTSALGRTSYTVGCQSKTVCQGKSLAADRLQCCDSHLCNTNKALALPLFSYTTPLPTTTTPVPTTTTMPTTTTTTPATTTAADTGPYAISEVWHNIDDGMALLQCGSNDPSQGATYTWSRMVQDFDHSNTEVYHDTGHGVLSITGPPHSMAEAGVYECRVSGGPPDESARFVVYKEIPRTIDCRTDFVFGSHPTSGIVFRAECPAGCQQAPHVSPPLHHSDIVCESAMDRGLIPQSGGQVTWLIDANNQVALIKEENKVVTLVK